MAGVSRSGFQRVADAVWSLVSLANRTVTAAGGSVTTVTGNVNGNVSGSVASVATGGITANSLAADAITAAQIAADAIGASEFSQGAADKVWSTAARTITGGAITTNNDKSGYALTQNSYAVSDFSQRGTINLAGATSNTAAISSVALSKSLMATGGHKGSSVRDAAANNQVQQVLSTTVVTATRTAQDAGDGVTCAFEVTDYAG